MPRYYQNTTCRCHILPASCVLWALQVWTVLDTQCMDWNSTCRCHSRRTSFALCPVQVWTVLDTESMDWNVGPLLRDSLALGLSNDHNMILVVNAGHWFNRAKLFDK